MQPLEQLQHEFLAMLRGANPAMGLGESRLPHAHSCDIYRRNYRENHIAALADTYERVKSLVGSRYFRELAKRYVDAHPSQNADLNHYGSEFADFLEKRLPSAPGGEQLPYLPDVARLDWAQFKALLSASGHGLCLANLSTLSSTQQAQSRISLAPGSTLLISRYPILQLWRVAQGQQDGANLDAEGETVFVCRPHRNVETHLLDAPTTHLLQLWQQKTLAASLAQLQKTQGDALVGDCFTQLQPLAYALELRIH